MVLLHFEGGMKSLEKCEYRQIIQILFDEHSLQLVIFFLSSCFVIPFIYIKIIHFKEIIFGFVNNGKSSSVAKCVSVHLSQFFL